jgi:SAM-dependent methyltransferase
LRKTCNELYRASFVSAALSEGLYDILRKGPASLDNIQNAMGLNFYRDGMEAWLDFGVSLGELRKNSHGYEIKGALSKQLSKSSNDTWQAYLQARANIFHEYIMNTPKFLRSKMLPELSEGYGELFARSSRTLEPILLDVVDAIIPEQGNLKVLEIGCGSGVYIEQACKRNRNIHVVGLELHEATADFAKSNMKKWGIDHRVSIEVADIRNYHNGEEFDLITFHNLIYYFSLVERPNLLSHMKNLLKPSGKLVISTLCQSKDPGISSLNLWSSMTDGCGPLPNQTEMYELLRSAGFVEIQSKRLIPGYWLFIAHTDS